MKLAAVCIALVCVLIVLVAAMLAYMLRGQKAGRRALENMMPAVFYINLAHRHDRRAEIETVLRNVEWLEGSTRIDAVLDSTNGHMGCLKSHIKALKAFMETPSQIQYAVILEDDCEFIHDPRPGMQEFLADHGSIGWDVLMLASNAMREGPYLPYATRVFDSQTCAGYAITKPFARKLLAHWQQSISAVPFLACDQSWKQLQPQNRWFSLLPKPGRQRPSFSDIERRRVDYGV